MTVAPVKRLLWILATLLTLLAATVVTFEIEQAKREAPIGAPGPAN
jgi:hypothetical protein